MDVQMLLENCVNHLKSNQANVEWIFIPTDQDSQESF
jgi:hypothetical protein